MGEKTDPPRFPIRAEMQGKTANVGRYTRMRDGRTWRQ